uniref:peptidyl-tRNA hydrolase n=1 Tax=Steinernema glaseri TaxID=37863 RepID=A0A1I7Y590_9BILA
MAAAAVSENLVMYLILRRDLITELKWPLGAVITQGAHASTACMWMFKEDPAVLQYTKNLDSMHKVTLEVANEEALKKVETKLQEASVDHKTWVEDDMKVCIAVKPSARETLKPLLRNLKLFK